MIPQKAPQWQTQSVCSHLMKRQDLNTSYAFFTAGFSSSKRCVWAVHRVLGDFTCPVCSLLSSDLAISPHPTFPSPSYHALPLSFFTSLRGSPSINNAALSCHTLSREGVCVSARVWGDLFASTHKRDMHVARHHALCTLANMCIYSTF